MTMEQLEKGFNLKRKIDIVQQNISSYKSLSKQIVTERACDGSTHEELEAIGEDVRNYALNKLKAYEAKLQKEFKAL